MLSSPVKETSDVAFNPATGKYENLPVYVAFLAYEHDWNKAWSSTFTSSIIGQNTKGFQHPSTFQNGSKTLLSLFYKPLYIRGLIFGAEIEHAHRSNKDSPRNDATRASILAIYNY
jgi:hypothetical protein